MGYVLRLQVIYLEFTDYSTDFCLDRNNLSSGHFVDYWYKNVGPKISSHALSLYFCSLYIFIPILIIVPRIQGWTYLEFLSRNLPSAV